MREIPFLSIEGIKVGHAQNIEKGSGCTVVLCKKGAVAGVDVRGGAPGTRETDTLEPYNTVEKVNGVFLSGGSSFGLDVGGGIMKYLEEKGSGFNLSVARIPIVTGAVIFDLIAGDPKFRPDGAMGYAACQNAKGVGETLEEGCVGAGTGATVGKFLGPQFAMKSGLGAICFELGDLKVGAISAVNAFGNVVEPGTGQAIAGMLDEKLENILDSEKAILKLAKEKTQNDLFAGNTTISIVVTNAKLTKSQAKKIASIAHNGYARTIEPVHTLGDGDTIFTLGTGEVEANQIALGVMATKAIEGSVLRAAKTATTAYGYKGYVK